jgi:ubiquinol-cytochrome c reductase iron-sulfur subunit
VTDEADMTDEAAAPPPCVGCPEGRPGDSADERSYDREVRWVVGLLLLSTVAAVGLAVTWATEGTTALQGLLLGISLLALGAALGIWANTLTGDYETVEPRPSLAPSPSDELAADEVDPPAVARRGLLVKAAVLAGGALGVAALLPIKALGPSPGHKLLHTPWRKGRQLVNGEGAPVRSDDIPLDGLVTAFPRGSDAADGQIVVVRVRPDELRLPDDRKDWAPNGLVAYSKVCTHAGCPVGLYNAESKELLCPCHQSSFDVLRGARPRSGPAVWPLPQLPLEVGDDGVLRAGGELSAPVGAGWWKRK